MLNKYNYKKQMIKEVKVLGFHFTKIKVEKNPNFEGKLEVSQNIEVVSVEKQKLDMIKDEVLKINFTFSASYKELGSLSMSGTLFLFLDSKSFKEGIVYWQKNKKLSEELGALVINLLIQKCTPKALQLEEDMGLPLHMPMPQVQSPSNQDKK